MITVTETEIVRCEHCCRIKDGIKLLKIHGMGGTKHFVLLCPECRKAIIKLLLEAE